MKLSSVSLLSCFAASAIAADCSGPVPANVPSDLLHVYWDARVQMCSNSNCPYQQDCQVQTSATNGDSKTLTVTLKRQKNGVDGFKDCWDATDNIVNQCVYYEHTLNGQWEYGGQTFILESTFNVPEAPAAPPPQLPPAAPTCDTSKYCAYTYNNNNCGIKTWKCDDCDVVVFWECITDATCSGGKCVNNLCCHSEKLANGAEQCPTTDDLKLCGNFVRQLGTGSSAAWVPPYADIPDNLKCGC